jgi:hypothetical protein
MRDLCYIPAHAPHTRHGWRASDGAGMTDEIEII